MSNEIDVYNRLVIRDDVYAQQTTKTDDRGKYTYHKVDAKLTAKDYITSLETKNKTIGVYTLDKSNNVINPTIDIDNHDGKTNVIDEVKIIFNALNAAGMYPYIEASAGDIKDGAHIGVICKPTLAKNAKYWMQKALDTTGLKHEVNPKQEVLSGKGFGNLVKLPFQYNNRTNARSQIYNPETLEPFNRDDAIKYMLALPESVFEEIGEVQTPIPTENALPKAFTEANKSNSGLDSILNNPKLKTCVVKAYYEKWVLHGTGDEGHNFRIATAGNLLYNGATKEQVHEYFSIQTDYKPSYTEEQIKSIESYLGTNRKPMGCKALFEKCPTLLNGMCNTCTMRPKEKKPREPRDKHIKNDVIDTLDMGFGVYRDNMGLAEEMQKITPIIYDTSKNLWLYLKNKGYYERIDDTDILSVIRMKTDEYVIEGTKAGEIKRAIQITGRERFRNTKEIKESWINTSSGLYDIETGEIIKPNPEYFLKCPVPHKIGNSTDTPIIDKLFNDWIGDRKQILYEILAYCLYDSYPIHRMFILFGSGRNGKSQFIELIERFVGKENTTSTELEKLIDSRFECCKLYRKKVASIGETNFTAIKSSDRIKKITGHDTLTAEFKGKDAFDFKNTAKIIIASNSIPETLDKTEAFHSRCIIIEFKNRFNEGKPIIDTIPESEYENLLRKCLKILPELLKNGKFTNEGTIEEKAERYERLSNPFPTFKDKELIEKFDCKAPIFVIRDMYGIFCKKNGFRTIGDREFTQLLHKEGYETKKEYWGKYHCNTVYGLCTKEPIIFDDNGEISQMSQMSQMFQSDSHIGNQVEVCGTSGTSGTTQTQVYKEPNILSNTVTELTNAQLTKYTLIHEIISKTKANFASINQLQKSDWDKLAVELSSTHHIHIEYANEIVREARAQMMKVS